MPARGGVWDFAVRSWALSKADEMSNTLTRRSYPALYGPTTGDRIRLADTELILCVERDLTVYGEEVKFGGGKVIRDGMGQSQRTRAAGAGEAVITNSVISDQVG